MRRGEPVPLRAHHGLCFAFFRGKGYSEGFTAHMGRTLAVLRRENPPVRLLIGEDVLCSACPNNLQEKGCSSCKPADYDAAVLRLCGLREGDILPYRAFAAAAEEKILAAGLRETVCGDCLWNELCAGIAAEG